MRGNALGCCMWPGSGCQSSISHVIPQQLIQTLNLYRWNCNVFGRSRKVTVGNYVRNLSGCGLATAHGHRRGFLRLEGRPCPPDPPRPPHRRHLVADRWLGALSPCCPAGSCRRHSNFARNSSAACSNIEFVSLELQRFRRVSKSDRGELCAKFVWLWSCDRPWAPSRVPAARGPPVPSGPSGPTSAFRTSGAWCAVVVARSIFASRSVQNSPCSASWWSERYKTLPACRRSAKLSHFGRAGRVLYRTCGEGGCAGRVLYRRGAAWLLLGE